MLADIFIATVDEGEAFNPEVHARHDFDAVSYKLKKPGEADFWSCEVSIRNPGLAPFRPGAKRRVHISERCSDGVVRHVFTGRIEGWPLGPAGKQVTITIMGAPLDRQQVEADALAHIDDDPWALFRDRDAARDSATILAARYACLNWRRDDAAPVLVDMLQGSSLIDVGSGFVEGSLQFEQLTQPITQVDVTVKAQWLQSKIMIADVGGAIGNFYSADTSLDEIEMPRVGDSVGEWTVMQSGLVKNGQTTEVLFNLAGTSPVSGDTSVSWMAVETIPRASYTPYIWVGAVATAKRTEIMKFSLVWSGQPLAGYGGQIEKIELECRDLQGRAEAPDFVPGGQYQSGAIVMVDGVLYQCNRSHIAGASIFTDWANWDPVIINGIDPVGGSDVDWFFGQQPVARRSG